MQFHISVVSDTVCPWCYVGKQNLDRGIALYKKANPNNNDTFTTTWLPFLLNPAAPTTSVDTHTYLSSRLGAGKAAIVMDRLITVGKEVGIDFKFGGKTGATRDSHRLIHLGRMKGPQMQTRVVEELFKSYFENNGDIVSHEMLLKAGVKAGLDADEVKGWLDSDQGGSQVDREVMEAKMRNVSGVPNFVLQDKYEIGGAQEPENFVKVFERIKELEGM